MNKYIKYGLIGIGSIAIILAIVKMRNEKNEPIIDKDMEDLIKRIDQAKK